MSRIEEGLAAPAQIKRPAGSLYRHIVTGIIYRQEASPSGNNWKEEAPVDLTDDSIKDTGEKVNGKIVYIKYLEGVGFTNPGSYTIIPTGIDMTKVTIIDSYGWCDYADNQSAKLYATYIDTNGNFRSYWTGATNRPWRVFVKYTIN